MSATCFELEEIQGIRLLRLISADDTNRLTREVVLALTRAISELATTAAPLLMAGNQRFFSAGADLREIAALDATSAYEFSKMGQALMRHIDNFPAPIYAAISGYCMGGGLDLALLAIIGSLPRMPFSGIGAQRWDLLQAGEEHNVCLA